MRFTFEVGAMRLRIPLVASESGVPLARSLPRIAVGLGTHAKACRVREAHSAGNKCELLALACSNALTGISAA